MKMISYQEAIRQATYLEMRKDKNVFVCGIGITSHSKAFGTTEGIEEKFGSQRCFDTPISEERVWEAFDADLNIAIAECHHLFPGDEFEGFPEEAQQVIVNMMFNMGRPRLSGFKKFIAACKEGDWKTAAVEGRDSKWHKQVTNRAERLMVRLENI